MPGESRPEFSRPVAVAAIPAGGRPERIEAGEAERVALARRFDIPAIESLHAELRLLPETGGSVRVTGRMAARVVQSCVVTLDPVTQEVEEPVDLRFRPESEALSDDPDGPDEIALEGGVMDLGEAVAEQLSLALDPYPRAPGAAVPEGDAPPAGEDRGPNPFAALRGLKGRG